ncbi:MAG: hypothetical protein ABR992_13090 [Solirubrobacteraceae bacterium]
MWAVKHGTPGGARIEVFERENLGLRQVAQQLQRRAVDPLGAHQQPQPQSAGVGERADQLEDVYLRARDGAVEGARVERHPQAPARPACGLQGQPEHIRVGDGGRCGQVRVARRERRRQLLRTVASRRERLHQHVVGGEME